MYKVAYGIQLAICLMISSTVACGRRNRTNLPHNVRNQFARDFSCRARNIDGTTIAPSQYHVFGCNTEAVYTCSGGRNGCMLTAQGPYAEGQPSMLSAPAQNTVTAATPATSATLVLQTQAGTSANQTLDQYLQIGQATLESCGLLCPVVVHAAWSAEGAVTLTLPNAPGSTAETCLKNAVEPNVRVGGGNGGGATITLPCDGQ